MALTRLSPTSLAREADRVPRLRFALETEDPEFERLRGMDALASMLKPKKLSLVIPAYNEENRIAGTVRDFAHSLRDVRHEILVELDGCNDHTAERVRDVQAEYPSIKILEFPERLGKGRGVLAGMQEATGDWVAFIDADGSVSPAEFSFVAKAALADGADAVIASRYWNRQHMMREIGILRWTASRSFNLLVREMYGLPYRDTQCGAKILRRPALDMILREMKLAGYAFDVELLWRLRRHNFKVVELPILWTHRDGSTVKLAHVASRMFLDVLRLRVNP